jgi:hypothetical protein
LGWFKRGKFFENKGEEKKMKQRESFERRIGTVGGTCGRKP